MLRKIKLYGKLAKFVGQRVLEADVHNAAEAVRFLVVNWPALEQHMADQYYKVEVGSNALTLEETVYPLGSDDISITPVVAGAGNVGTYLAKALESNVSNINIKLIELNQEIAEKAAKELKKSIVLNNAITVDANTLLKFVGSVDPADTFVVAENVTFYDDGSGKTFADEDNT